MTPEIDNDLRKQLARIEVVSFDLDDTIWPLYDTLMRAERKQYEWLQQHCEKLVSQLSMDDLLRRRRLFIEANPQYAGDVTAMRKRSLESVFQEFGYSHSQSIEWVEKVFEVFYLARSEVTLFDGTRECLEALKTGYKLAALTNGNADLQIAGVDDLFDDARFATLETPPKPDPTMFRLAAEALGTDTSRMLHVGDNVITDVGGGQCAGTLTVWFNPDALEWPKDLAPPTLTISHMSQLLSLLPRA